MVYGSHHRSRSCGRAGTGHGPVLRVFQDADVAEVAVVLVEVQAVTDYEFVGDLEADVGDVHGAKAAVGLIEQRGDADGFGLTLLEQVDEVGEGDAAIDDVFDHQNMMALDGDVQILGDFYLARTGLAAAVAGYTDELDSGWRLDGARQVGHEDESAFEDGDEIDGTIGIIGGDPDAHLFDARANLLGGEERAGSGQHRP